MGIVSNGMGINGINFPGKSERLQEDLRSIGNLPFDLLAAGVESLNELFKLPGVVISEIKKSRQMKKINAKNKVRMAFVVADMREVANAKRLTKKVVK
jgi:hypothetical protein